MKPMDSNILMVVHKKRRDVGDGIVERVAVVGPPEVLVEGIAECRSKFERKMSAFQVAVDFRYLSPLRILISPKLDRVLYIKITMYASYNNLVEFFSTVVHALHPSWKVETYLEETRPFFSAVDARAPT